MLFQIFKNHSSSDHWKCKFLCIGNAAMDTRGKRNPKQLYRAFTLWGRDAHNNSLIALRYPRSRHIFVLSDTKFSKDHLRRSIESILPRVMVSNSHWKLHLSPPLVWNLFIGNRMPYCTICNYFTGNHRRNSLPSFVCYQLLWIVLSANHHNLLLCYSCFHHLLYRNHPVLLLGQLSQHMALARA